MALLLVIASGSVKAQKKPQPKTAKEYFDRASTYYKKGYFDRAIQDLTNAIALNPKDLYAYYNRGNAYFAKRDFERAIQDYSQVISLDPKYTDAYIHRATAYRMLGKNELADADEKVLMGGPTTKEQQTRKAQQLLDRGIARAMAGNFDSAIEDFSQAISLDPDHAYGYLVFRGDAYSDKGDYERAMQDFNQAISLNPTYSVAYRYRALLYRKLGKNELADRDEKAEQSAEQRQRANEYLSRGDAYLKKGDQTFIGKNSG